MNETKWIDIWFCIDAALCVNESYVNNELLALENSYASRRRTSQHGPVCWPSDTNFPLHFGFTF